MAPEVLSLRENPEESILFLNRILQTCDASNVYVDLAGVVRITPEAIAALLARIHRTRHTNAHVSGNLPRDAVARSVIDGSGFRDYVNSRRNFKPMDPMGRVRKRSRSSETVQTKYDQAVALELIEFAAEKLWGERRSHGPSYAVYGELMLNTLNHASTSRVIPEPWWASVYFDKAQKRACFTFVDQGVGIFGSHSLTQKLKLQRALGLKAHSDIMKMLFHGEIPSSTEVEGRGNGIPGIYNHCKAGRIANLFILSNDVAAYAHTELYRGLRNTFSGTIIYWEVRL